MKTNKQLCECGCGQYTTGMWHRERKCYPRFIKYHSLRSKKIRGESSWNKGNIEYFLGSNNPHWKGGYRKCPTCGKELHSRYAKFCFEHKSKENLRRGANHPNWKGGTTLARQKTYDSPEYNKWRKTILEKDNYTCRMCGKQSKKGKFNLMAAHHILSYSEFPEFGLDPENGACLCTKCHLLIRTREWMYIPKFLNI